MSKYSEILYNQATYGQKSRLAFAVEPFTAVALDYNTVSLKWSAPLGGYTAFRVLRNQDGYSETIEDGVPVYTEYGIDGTTGAVSITEFHDGKDNPNDPALVGGRFAYYRAWILKASDSVWYPAGDTLVLVPKGHPTYGINNEVLLTTHDKLMAMLPKVFTSGSQSPIDEVNPDSDLYRFLQGFSFTLDEFLTMAESLLPNFSEKKSNPSAIVAKANQLGLNQEPNISIKHQKRMIREAMYMYSRKGTPAAINTLAESLTGYPVTVSISPNLMLSSEDSTFNRGIGSWTPIGDCTITLEDINPVTSESASIDRLYSAKVVVGTSGAQISNGSDYPITRGIPVQPSIEYGFSYYAQKNSGTGGIVAAITWYDHLGVAISTSTNSSVTANTTWAKPATLFKATSPSTAVYASISLKFNATGTYYVDMIQLATSDITDFNEARAVQIFLDPKKINLILNPSFEDGYTNWNISSGTASTVSGTVPNEDLTGTHQLSVSAGTFAMSTDTPAGSVATGEYATGSIYAYANSGSEQVTVTVTATESVVIKGFSVTGNVATLYIVTGPNLAVGDLVNISGLGSPYNGVKTLTAVAPGTVSFAVTHSDVSETAVDGTFTISVSNSTTSTISNSWSRVYSTLYIPNDYSAATSYLSMSVSGTFTDVVKLDAAQLEPTFLPTDFFDGDFGTERDALWAGTPSSSISYSYPNKIVNIARLTSEIADYLPQDTPYTISSYSGIEASGFTD